ncbi:MAG: rod shape-determining protein [Acidobacteriota bacterium]|nr:rod shape-determining protein [Acidobacteriota bacterium]
MKGYCRIKPDWLAVKNVDRGILVEDVPQVALKNNNGNWQPIAFGREADLAPANDRNAVIVNGFKHPRVIIDDFEAAELVFKHFLKKANLTAGLFTGAPILIFHYIEPVAGGLSKIETRALTDLGFRLGAKNIYLLSSHEAPNELTDGEIRDFEKNLVEHTIR